jgi:molybdate transport system substrate-binding protein
LTAPALKILSTHALAEVLAALGPQLERARGRPLACAYDPSKALRRRIDQGEGFDVAIATRAAIDALTAAGRIDPASRADVARSGLGVSVRAGGARPDIGTADAFKRALLAAKTVARSREGASGAAFEALLARLGIAEEMQNKIVLAGSGRIAALAARGEAELAVQQISELKPVQGTDFVGPLPPDLQVYTTFTAGIAAGCNAQAEAARFIAMLTAPAAAPLITASGLEAPAR